MPTTFNPEITSDAQLVAASLASHGWPVIPLHSRTRTPYGSGGEHHRGIWITDPSEVPDTADAYAEETGGGSLSWGVMCGEPSPDGWRLVVLDTDDDEAARRLDVALKRYGAEEWASSTLTVRTNRGRHLYGLTRREVPTGKPWSGFDLKGSGGYVVVAGCVHPNGGHYADVTGDAGTVLNGDTPPAYGVYRGLVEAEGGMVASRWSVIREIPDALLDVLVRPLEAVGTTAEARERLKSPLSAEQDRPLLAPRGTAKSAVDQRPAPKSGNPEDVDLAQKRVDALLDRVRTAERGEGNAMLNWAAGRAAALCAVNGDLDPAAIRAQLVDAFTSRPVPPGETDRSREREAQATVASGWRYGTEHPEVALSQPRPATDPSDCQTSVDNHGKNSITHPSPPKGGLVGTDCRDSGYRDPDPLRDRVHSWEALDIGPYLDRKITPPEPSVLRRPDGVGLFYAGMVNLLYGASESGKSWVALHTALETMRDGESVLYVDLEDMPHGTVHRLLSLGAEPDVLRERFGYVHPEGGVSPLQVNRWGEPSATVGGQGNWQAFKDEIRQRDPALIVVDGMTVLYGFHGLDTNSASNTDVITDWLKSLTEYGRRTVLLIDHTSKNAVPGSTPTGSQHKTSMVQGSSIQVTPVTRPRVGHRGEVRLTVSKDRHGSLRGACPDQDPQPAADVTITSDGVGAPVRLKLHVPRESVGVLAPTDDMSKQLSNLEKDTDTIMQALSDGQTRRTSELRLAMGGDMPDKRFRDAIKALKLSERIVSLGAGPSTRYRIKRGEE